MVCLSTVLGFGGQTLPEACPHSTQWHRMVTELVVVNVPAGNVPAAARVAHSYWELPGQCSQLCAGNVAAQADCDRLRWIPVDAQQSPANRSLFVEACTEVKPSNILKWATCTWRTNPELWVIMDGARKPLVGRPGKQQQVKAVESKTGRLKSERQSES